MTPVSSPTLPSERRFGALFTVVFLLAGAYGQLVKGWDTSLVTGLFAASAVVAVVTIAVPKALAPFNKAWFQLGLLMGRIVSPIVLGAIFFLLLTPVGIIGRLLGRDELRLKKRPVSTWWIDRNPPGPPGDSFKNQF